jgi:subtilisin family serine protease
MKDLHGHGTFMTTLLAAVAPEAEIVPIKILNKSGFGTEGEILQGVGFALEQNVQIMAFMFRLPNQSEAFTQAIKQAHDKGILVIGPAGQGDPAKAQAEPETALTKSMLIVGAVDKDLRLAAFSNFGPGVHLYAPGVNVWAGWKDGTYQRLNGNTVATAMVSGVAALLKEARPGFTNDQLANTLLLTARALPGQGMRLVQAPSRD